MPHSICSLGPRFPIPALFYRGRQPVDRDRLASPSLDGAIARAPASLRPPWQHRHGQQPPTRTTKVRITIVLKTYRPPGFLLSHSLPEGVPLTHRSDQTSIFCKLTGMGFWLADRDESDGATGTGDDANGCTLGRQYYLQLLATTAVGTTRDY